MSLTIDNPDYKAVREGFADEEIDFWDIPDHCSHFFPQDSKPADELAALVEDYHRVNRQARELCELMPSRKPTVLLQLSEAVDEVELKVKKLLGNKVRYHKGG